jgi:serine/threonine-protein kinase
MPVITDSIGRVLGKRYRLLSALGTGASAHVFLAEDVSLQRHVAVKVLQPGFATDDAFLKRFRAEARSVASLNHPHVLRVFDWGEDTDSPYLVLEYLGGGSLRDMLDRDVRLSHSQAAQLGTEVAQGLAYAHGRGLVHRDIKPANLLFDEEGRVRVADFGVARALAEAAWTEPAGAMVGTARYISPEAAEGKTLDGRADVYSLALVLYEAVTGNVPFVSDTTMGTLAARIGQPLPHHDALGPLDDVLARAAAPEASARLDAAGLAARLGALAAALPTPAPLPLVPSHADTSAPIAAFQAPGLSQLTEDGTTTAIVAASEKVAPIGTKAGPGEVFDAEPFPNGSRAGVMAGLRKPKKLKKLKQPRTRRHWGWRRFAWIAAALVLAAMLAVGLTAAFSTDLFTPTHPTPALSGLTVQRARAEVSRVHMTLRVEPAVKSTSAAAGTIVSQSPRAHSSQKEGTVVTVVPSAGPPIVAVPNLSGMTCATATAALQQAHFQSVCAPPAYNNNGVPEGVLVVWSIGNTANPTQAPYGSTITLVPSGGHAPATVPDIPSSYTFAQAEAALQAVGLTASQNQEPSNSVPAGQVITPTEPPSGASVGFGSNVQVNVSTGAPTTTVPSVSNQSVAQATATLQAAGLNATWGGGDGSKPVTTTNPPIGSPVPAGSSVQIFTS